MGWQIGFDSRWNRDIGYGVPATCDRPRCGTAIDRGLSFVCGSEPYGGEKGCGLFFCGEHLTGRRRRERGDSHFVWICGRCDKGRTPYEPTPDVAKWMTWKLTDESWARWRTENPDEVRRMKEAIGSKGGGQVRRRNLPERRRCQSGALQPPRRRSR